MRRLTRISAALAVASGVSAGLFLACSSADPAPASAQPDANIGAGNDGAIAEAAAADANVGTVDAGADASCPPLANDTPHGLDCTGLYADVATKQLADGIREFTPAIPFWSDGADKTRWISLPPGTTIDVTDVNEWTFPVGTKLWKEFRVAGHRVETRLFEKLGANLWVHASYAWASDELSATRADGADITTVDGAAYHIPTPSECDKCHNGRKDRVLGFDAVSLGLPNAVGVTLAMLAQEGRLKPTPTTTSYAIGDDGTGKSAAALGWLNINCGVTCHNGNTTATAYPTGFRTKLDANLLDGGAPGPTWDTYKTGLGIGAVTPRWSGIPRIVAGQPDHSLLVQLISERGTDQMPPLSTYVVDEKDVQVVRAWITALPPPLVDGGADGGDGGDGG